MVLKDSTPPHIALLLRSYLSTRTVLAAETAAEVPMMLNAETKELLHAAGGVTAADQSLPPRPVSVTLLAYGTTPDHCKGARTHLDALAHLASTPLELHGADPGLSASRIRMTVLAGVDAAWYALQVQASAVDSKPSIDVPGGVDICVRWALPCGEGVRCEFKQCSVGLGLDRSLQEMQNYFLSLRVAFQTPFPSSVAMTHNNVPRDAWAQSMYNATRAFFELMNGKPGVYKDRALTEDEGKNSIVAESTGIFVRICPRKAHAPIPEDPFRWVDVPLQESVLRHDAFHAFLIGNAEFHDDIAEHCKQFQKTGLPPLDEESARFCLHTCAVQANDFRLGGRVSLYATHHRAPRMAGSPITSPGSWIWRTNPAIVALEHVVKDFYVLPCSRESVLPGDNKLERAFNTFFSRAFTLYAQVFGSKKALPIEEEFERMPLSLPPVPEGGDPAIRSAEDYALTAFGLDASARRIVVGDAYALLNRNHAPAELTELMLQSALKSGINTPVLDALGKAARALSESPTSVTAVRTAENARLKRVADAALDISAKIARPPSKAVDMEASRVKQLLSYLGLKKGADCYLPKHPKAHRTAYSAMVTVLSASVLRGPTDAEVHDAACEAARRARPSGDMASISAAITVLRSSLNAITATSYMVSHTDGSDKVCFSRVGFNGQFETATPGAVVDAPVKTVVILKSSDRGLRLTATTAA